MAIVKSYRTCDICGKRLPHNVDKWNYRIDPPSKLQITIWKYIFSNPYDGFWNASIDMC